MFQKKLPSLDYFRSTIGLTFGDFLCFRSKDVDFFRSQSIFLSLLFVLLQTKSASSIRSWATFWVDLVDGLNPLKRSLPPMKMTFTSKVLSARMKL